MNDKYKDHYYAGQANSLLDQFDVREFSATSDEVVFTGFLFDCKNYVEKNQVRLGSMCNLLHIYYHNTRTLYNEKCTDRRSPTT